MQEGFYFSGHSLGVHASACFYALIDELLKYAGLNPYEISSGMRKGQRRISKHGRVLMRKLFYFAALNVVRKGGILHDRYQRELPQKRRVEAQGLGCRLSQAFGNYVCAGS